MTVKLRPGVPDDAKVCGQICYEAFGSLAAAHGFPSDFPSPETAIGLVGMLLGHPGFHSLVAVNMTEGDVLRSVWNGLGRNRPFLADVHLAL